MSWQDYLFNQVKRKPIESKKIFTNHISDKGVISKIKNSCSSTTKIQITQLRKWAKCLIDVSPKKIYSQQIHEEMFKITNHQGNIRWNHNEISPHNMWLLTLIPYDLAIPILVYTQKNRKQSLKEIFAHPCS